jgi:DHA2 family multidrug resistance protein-like MFS transporter
MATSAWVMSFLGGGALGPILGGVILQPGGGAVFLTGVPAMLILLAAGPALLPEYRNPAAGRIDPPSAASHRHGYRRQPRTPHSDRDAEQSPASPKSA